MKEDKALNLERNITLVTTSLRDTSRFYLGEIILLCLNSSCAFFFENSILSTFFILQLAHFSLPLYRSSERQERLLTLTKLHY